MNEIKQLITTRNNKEAIYQTLLDDDDDSNDYLIFEKAFKEIAIKLEMKNW